VPEAVCVLLTGRAGAGKATVGSGIAAELRRRGRTCAVLDATGVEAFLQPGIGALVWCCELLTTAGATAVVTVPIATRDARDRLRDAVPGVVEVFLDAPPAVCAERARHDDPAYEPPYAPELRVPTHDRDPTASVAQVISFLEEHGMTPRDPPHPSEPVA
jgi:adenylylsulfate kinase